MGTAADTMAKLHCATVQMTRVRPTCRRRLSFRHIKTRTRPEGIRTQVVYREKYRV